MVFALSGGVKAGVSELSAQGTVAGRPWRGSCMDSRSCSHTSLCQKSLKLAARLRQGSGSCTSSRAKRILNCGFWEILARDTEHLISCLHSRTCHRGGALPTWSRERVSVDFCLLQPNWKVEQANKATWSHVGEHRTATSCLEQGKISLCQ